MHWQYSHLFYLLKEQPKHILNLKLTIPTGATITVTNDAIDILLVVTDKTINDLSK